MRITRNVLVTLLVSSVVTQLSRFLNYVKMEQLLPTFTDEQSSLTTTNTTGEVIHLRHHSIVSNKVIDGIPPIERNSSNRNINIRNNDLVYNITSRIKDEDIWNASQLDRSGGGGSGGNGEIESSVQKIMINMEHQRHSPNFVTSNSTASTSISNINTSHHKIKPINDGHEYDDDNDNNEIPVVCLRKDSGRGCNWIIQITNALQKARRMGGKLGLGPIWTERYNVFFDPRDEVLLNVPEEQCPHNMTAWGAHMYHSHHEMNPALMDMLPKVSIRQEAEQAFNLLLNTYNNNNNNSRNMNGTKSKNTSLVVSVHRRWLEGQCHRRVKKGQDFCMKRNSKKEPIIPNMCNTTYQNVTDYLRQLKGRKKEYNENIKNDTLVVLFTDGQVPELDTTFPIRDDHPFPVQLWMMTLSDMHFGNPTSSVDHVVNHWRRGIRMQPSECFVPSENNENDNNNNDEDEEEQEEKEEQKEDEEELPALCLKGWYGRSSNGIIQIANAIRKARHKGGKLGLGPVWTQRYKEFFDPREDVLLDFPEEKCPRNTTAFHAHRYQSRHKKNHVLMDLLPKVSIRQDAERAFKSLLQKYSDDSLSSDGTNKNASLVVSVHRRWLEGQCHRRVRKGEDYCIGHHHKEKQLIVPNMCNTTYTTVTDHLRKLEREQMEYQNITKDALVVLFTDDQVPELDGTFPLRDDHPFPVQMWMMTLSDVHFGNPTSSVDYLVNHWRRGHRMQPSECYPSL